MDESDLLIVFAEIAIAIVGFSGIIATFQLRDGQIPRRSVLAGLGYIVNASFAAVYISLLPLVLHFFGLSDSIIWSICSWHYAVLPLAFIYLFNRDTRGIMRSTGHKVIHFSIQFVCALAALVNLLNALGIVFHQEPGPVLAGTVIGLGAAASLFSRLLLRPLKRLIIESEAGN
jgi:hypothetical protein